MMKIFLISALLSFSLFLNSCNTIGGFTRGVVDEIIVVKVVIPGSGGGGSQRKVELHTRGC